MSSILCDKPSPVRAWHLRAALQCSTAGEDLMIIRPFVVQYNSLFLRRSQAAFMIGILLGIAGVTAAVLASLGLHVVTEGHRGVYFRAGLLLNTTTSPGLHVQIPILDRHEQI